MISTLMLLLLPLSQALPQTNFNERSGVEIPQLSAGFDLTPKENGFELMSNVGFTDMQGYFFQAVMVVSVLLLLSNVFGVTLFPGLTNFLNEIGDSVSGSIQNIINREARNIDPDTLNQMADLVDKAIATYDNFQS
jgi:hypothetical protein